MNPRINQLVKTLLKKETIEQCSLEELRQFAERHPYFGAAQLLFTKKLQTEKSEEYDEQLQKTFLFFHNPLWVEHLLNDNGKTETVIIGKEEKLQPAMNDVPGKLIREEPVMAEPVMEETETVAESVTDTGTETVAGTKRETDSERVREAEIEGEIKLELKTDFGREEKQKPGNDLLFEPYHTVDYFASQGIRVREEERPADGFGRQLKSFTEWLKSMKKLPVAELTALPPGPGEKKVEEMAAHSLKEDDVVTEAMAAVWEKQGNIDKAIAIYHKLSLLEPAKSAYFAAKIGQLKKKD
jgi:hypothetical protein